MEQHTIRRAALRGLVPSVLTVAIVVGGAVGGRAGHGGAALLGTAGVAAVVAVVLGGAAWWAVVALTGSRDDLDLQWARVEPVWSGRN